MVKVREGEFSLMWFPWTAFHGRNRSARKELMARNGRHYRAGTSRRRPQLPRQREIRCGQRILPARYVGAQVADGLRLLGDNGVDEVAD